MQEVSIGIDPGFGRMGFGVVAREGQQFHALDFGLITTEKETVFGDRLCAIVQDLSNLFTLYKPTRIGLETILFAKSTTTVMRVAEVRGVVQYVAAREGILVVEFSPTSVKKALTGDGRADKRGMIEMVQRLLSLEAPPSPDDVADALGLAIAAACVDPRRLG